MKENILKKIVKRYGITVKEVRCDVQHALDVTHKKLYACSGLMPKKEKPTLEEFLADAERKVRNEINK